MNDATSTVYMIRLDGTLLSGVHATLEDARKSASGALLSRSSAKKAEVIPVYPGEPPGHRPFVALAWRTRNGGKVTVKP